MRLFCLSFAVFLAVISGCELRTTLEPTEPDYVNPSFPDAVRGAVKNNLCYAEDFAVSGDGYWVFAANRVRRYIDKTYVSEGPTSPNKIFFPESFPYTDRPNRLVASYFGDLLYCNFADRNTIYIIDTETMQETLLCEGQDNISELYLTEFDESILAVYFTEHLVDRFNALTGELEGSCVLPWPPIHSSLSPDKKTLAVFGVPAYEAALIDLATMSVIKTLDVGSAVTTFSYSGLGNYLVFFRGGNYKPAVNRYSLTDDKWWGWQECNRFYTHSHPVPGSESVAASRSNHNWLSVINAENMVFAPPLECPGNQWEVEASDNGQRIFVMTRWPHRIVVFHMD
ncbi:MAG: hypothetical protein KAH31_06795 [Candidatus Sabulitectum sp.]|nr:hypothetical protein [Candidatus Sabulitectum sp.]